MDSVNIIGTTGEEQTVNGILYIFNSKYYFMYTLGELDNDEYVKLYLVQIGKEVYNTPTGPQETGYMLGMEISNQEEWKKVQESITQLVEDKKSNTKSDAIKYLPIETLAKLKINSFNKFKLLKQIMVQNFNLNLEPVNHENAGADVIVDYRTKYFEEQEENAKLLEEVKALNEKLDNIKKVLG